MLTNRAKINGVEIYPFTSIKELNDLLKEKKGILIAINAGKIYNATEETRKLINENIGYLDGAGAMKAVQRKGFKNAIRIPGCELWKQLIADTYKENASYYFVGGKQEVIEEVISKLRTEFPAINIAGYRNGFIKNQEEETELIKDISHKKPDYVFVAMGSPKQELLMQKMQKEHRCIYQGLGGSFDLYTGRAKRAPQWFQDHYMEGLYRMVTNFNLTRLKRYWADIKFITNVYLGKY